VTPVANFAVKLPNPPLHTASCAGLLRTSAMTQNVRSINFLVRWPWNE
jgi:hypothetical protein